MGKTLTGFLLLFLRPVKRQGSHVSNSIIMNKIYCSSSLISHHVQQTLVLVFKSLPLKTTKEPSFLHA